MFFPNALAFLTRFSLYMNDSQNTNIENGGENITPQDEITMIKFPHGIVLKGYCAQKPTLTS
jgi:hypothetical protein